MLQEAVSLTPVISGEDEELQMTFQVAMVGRDGLVLGSDRKMRIIPTIQTGERGYARYAAQSKLRVNAAKTAIVACAGADRAWLIGEQVVAKFNPDLNSTAWVDYLKEECESREDKPSRDQILVVRCDTPDKFWWLSIGRELKEFEDKTSSGLPLAAEFFLQQFYKTNMELSSLENLALLTLDCAALEAPDSVGCGYDLMTLRNGKPHFQTYKPDCAEVLSIRARFQAAINDILYAISSPIVQM